MSYRAEWVDEGGLSRTAQVGGKDRAAALAALSAEQRHGLRRLSPPRGRPPALGELSQVAAGLARLLDRGVQLGPALRALSDAHRSGQLGSELALAAERAEDGASLAEALEAGGGVLAMPLVQALLSPDGACVALLGELAALANRLEVSRQQLLGRLAYPFFLAAGGSVLGAVVVVVAGGSVSSLDPRVLESSSVLAGMAWGATFPGGIALALAGWLCVLAWVWPG